MSKFHVGDKVRLQDRDGLFDQFYMDAKDGFNETWEIEIVGGFSPSSYNYAGPQVYVVKNDTGEHWDVPEEILRPADIFAQVDEDLSAIQQAVDVVNHPPHYNRFPVEVINITEQLDFNRGNAVKYLARAGFKEGVDELEDLSKAAWYVNRAIEKLKNERGDA